MYRTLSLGFLLLALLGCSPKPPKFSRIAEEFVLNSLTFWPSTATAVGYHRHNGVPLDELLDDFSVPALDRQRLYYRRFLQGLARDVTREKLTPEDQVDFDLVRQQIALAQFELDGIRTWEKNPQYYTNAFGNSLFVPWVQEYAPREARFFHILKRMERFRSRVEQAKANLKDVPPFWAEMGIAANRATLNMIAEIETQRPAEMATKFDAAAREAKAALLDLEAHLRKVGTADPEAWRLGPEKYKQKLQLHHGSPIEPTQLLAEAEGELARLQEEMARLSGWKGGPGTGARQAIRKQLDALAGDHAPRERYFASAESGLAEAIQFIGRKDLLTLPDTRNLKVIPTPAFMQGSYPVGGFNPAPPMTPGLGAQYWLTPIPEDWPKERVESKLREYNRFGLDLLTIHEAMPGHYVQFEYSNRIEPRSRRMLRSVFPNGAFAEGWAIYSTEMMIEQGFRQGEAGLRLTFLKQQLRAVANTILDIKFHTQNWKEEDALRFLLEETFQEKEEATAKIQRAKLSHVQLTEYFLGYQDFKRLVAAVRKKEGAQFRLKEFHGKVLALGAVPIAAAARILTGEDLKR